MAEPPRILLYAELLSNIRQVSVGCSLPSPCSASTEASVSTDGRRLTIRHQGEDCTIQLPKEVAVTQTLPIQKQSSKSLSWRLPISPISSKETVSSHLDSQIVPWSAFDLQPASAVKCRNCQTIVVDDGKLKVWKDLPSENWAEMMEFWHCHKPDDHDHDHGHSGNEEHLAGRGYGANSRLSGQAGTGFVDLTSFLFFEEDCTNLKTTTTGASTTVGVPGSVKQGTPASCANCHTEIGVLHEETASVTLYKWQLAISSPAADPQAQPSLSICVAAMLASTLSRSGCSKSVILPLGSSYASSPDRLLLIWLFNGDITFTSSALDSERSVGGVKVLYQYVTKEEAERMSESLVSNVQDVSLPGMAIDDLKQLLGRSQGWLPEGDRRFRDWTVGLLEKWNGR
ncbi:ubiquitin-conjugating enzyme E2-binding protein [Truncatella angustata]|uniref:Ubiquitin-conjugating enzyme E2-binding protein n=1 Tax=Truncatella angustata TaxID=152316 RepID=A0A9P9A2D6_9PEZI|nr:ubiquitin-conjugating enzyme E2-binding protein [Truncatella angustata]KAH6660601.1 ubiquitin-conjugating enzyme E2-binding protein [Truncatella angustata]KAH8203594.1 hypothetical protein TruAng_002227 [Truncatella angustata]